MQSVRVTGNGSRRRPVGAGVQHPQQVPRGFTTWWCGDLFAPDLPTTILCVIPDDVDEVLSAGYAIPDAELSRRVIERIRAL